MEECQDYRNQLIVSLQSVLAILATLRIYPELQARFSNTVAFIRDSIVALNEHDFNEARSRLASACQCSKTFSEWRTRDSFTNTLMASALKILKSAHQNGIDLLLVKCAMSSCLQSLPVEEATEQCALEGASEVIDEAFAFIHERSASTVEKLLAYLLGLTELPVEKENGYILIPGVGFVEQREQNLVRGAPMFNEHTDYDIHDLNEIIGEFENARELTPQAMEYGLRSLRRLSWINKLRTREYCEKYLAYVVDDIWPHHDNCLLCKYRIFHCYRIASVETRGCGCSHIGCFNNHNAHSLHPLTPESLQYLLCYYEARKSHENPRGFPNLDMNHFVRFWDKLHLEKKLSISDYATIRSITGSPLQNPSILNTLTPAPRRPLTASWFNVDPDSLENRGFMNAPRGNVWNILTPGEFQFVTEGLDAELLNILVNLDDSEEEEIEIVNGNEVPLENLDFYRHHYNTFRFRSSPRQATFLALFRSCPARCNTFLNESIARQQDIVLSQRMNFSVTRPHPFMLFFNVRATDNHPVRLMDTLRRAISDYRRLDAAPDYPIFL